jgi:ubiquinone biosynthesis protein UbiJ
MMNQILETFTPVMQDKLVLLLNHLLSAEPIAMQKLLPHQGKTIVLKPHAWPSTLERFLPPPPSLALVITPAGLFERVDQPLADQASLEVMVDAAEPLAAATAWLQKGMPPLRLNGDALLATDINWLVENIRWDVAADLEPWVGPVMAEQITRWGAWLKSGFNSALQRLQSLMQRSAS